ncbi:autotransporter outer membrane beta-barrel domain-containing protein [Dyella sp.]|uniref:autotransporter outer membrane beta-barrel domain-containing protein n=1 Tax=Dyella sp. TaxID=1869338 RepID=UPI002ED39CF1
MPRTRYIAGAITAALLFSSAASAGQFDKVVIFGDSLSDAGNISLATAPQVQPPLRFTTNPGVTASEILAANLGMPVQPSLLGGTDFAFGGAGLNNNSSPGPIPTLPQQLQMYLGATGGKADPRTLYQMWGGANDIFYLTATSTDPNVLAAGTAAAAQKEVQLLGQLQAAGAKYVVVYNLPDIGKTPESIAGGAAAQAGGTQLALAFNGVLNAGISQLSANGLNVIPVNTFGLLNEVIANPGAYGFTNVTQPACGAGASSVQCGPAGSGLPYTYAAGTNQTYLFADGVHPTTAAHALLGQYVTSIIRAPGQISLLGEAPLAASQAQNRALRNQMLADEAGAGTRFFANVDYSHQRFDGQDMSPKTTSNNVDLTLGADAKVNENFSMGVALGVGQHNSDFAGGGGYKLQDISGMAFATYYAGGAYVGAHVNFAQSNFSDIDRRIQLGSNLRGETGKADGSRVGGGLTGGYWFTFNNIRTGPFANLDWETVKLDGYTENGQDSTAMTFNSQHRDSLISTLGWRLQGNFGSGNITWSPYAELAWNHDTKADPREVTAGLVSMPGQFSIIGYTPDKSWGTADIGVNAKFSDNVSAWVGYSGRFKDDSQKYNSLNLGVRFGF